jgi:ribosome-associated protein
MEKKKLQVEKIIEWALEKKAEEVKFYDIHEESDFTDFVVVCEGSGRLHVQAIANNIIDRCKEHGIHIYSKEGLENGTWALIDLVDIVIHVFDEKTRAYYKIDELLKSSSNRSFDDIKNQHDSLNK